MLKLNSKKQTMWAIRTSGTTYINYMDHPYKKKLKVELMNFCEVQGPFVKFYLKSFS